MRLTNKHREKIHRMRSINMTYEEIARAIGCSLFSVQCELNPEFKDRARAMTREWARNNK